MVYNWDDKLLICVCIDEVASQYPKFVADIILLFADIKPDTLKLLIFKLFVSVVPETIKLFEFVVPDIVKLLVIDSELVIIDELLFILSLNILYYPFRLFIII